MSSHACSQRFSVEIAEATISNDNQGRLTFLMYVEMYGGLMPENALKTILKVCMFDKRAMLLN